MADPKKVFGGLGKMGKRLLSPEEVAVVRARGFGVPGVDFADPVAPASMRLSEALGNAGAEGKTLNFTEADRSRVQGQNRGGVGFSGLQHYSKPHKKANTVWGFGNTNTAEKKIRQNDPENSLWTTFVGSPTQHRSNSVVIGDAIKEFQKSVKQGVVPVEQIMLMNKRLNELTDLKTGAKVFQNGFDLTDPSALSVANTFARRSAVGDVMLGLGVKGPMARKDFKNEFPNTKFVDGSNIENILKRETDPDLVDANTYDVGNRLFVLDGKIIQRPDLNEAFPDQVTGYDLGMKYGLVPPNKAMRDFYKAREGRLDKNQQPSPVGYYDLARVEPSQVVDEDYLTYLQKAGYKKGGAVDIDAADARLAQAIQARMAKGGAVDMEAADARLEAAINARMAGGGGAFKKIEFMAGGGRMLKGLGKMGKRLLAEPAPQQKIIQAPSIIIPSKISNVKEAVRQSKGEYGAKRVERAADEIPNLERLYQEEALKQAFQGDNAKPLMTINPKDFENYAMGLPTRTVTEPRSFGDKTRMSTEDYLKYLRTLPEGFDDIPFLEINKQEQGLPLMPFISGHEGRHRNRAMAEGGEKAGLVRLFPRQELREGFPRRSQEEYIEALKKELEMTGNLVLPEHNRYNPTDVQRPAIELPDIYAKGGGVHMAGGGGKLKALGDIAKKFLADAPQAEALKLAQQRAALPKTKHGLGLPADNTPQQRAKAMGGKDKVHFSRHGGDYTTLDSGKFAIAPFDAVGTHVGTPEAAMERYQNTVGYKVNNPNYANDELKGVTYPVTILGDRPMMNQKGLPFGEDELNAFLRQQGGHNWSDTQGGKMTYQDMNAKLRKKLFEEQGYTSIPYYNEVEGKGSISYIVPPDNIRSRFAAFDPFRRDAATAAAMGVLAPDLMAEEKKKSRGGLLHMADAGRVFKGVKSIGKRFMADPAESSVASARRGERTADQIGGLNIVKETGGNFLTGRTAKDLSPLKRNVGRADETRLNANTALNNWIDSNLTNYVEKQMGTANDPVRLMFDKRAQEIDAKYAKDIAKSDLIAQKATKELDPRKQANLMREAERIKAEANIERQIAVNHISHNPSLLQEYSRTAENVKKQRMEAGFSEEGVGQSPIAKAWERASDEAIATHRAGDIQDMPEKYAKLIEVKNKFNLAEKELNKNFLKHIENSGLNDREKARFLRVYTDMDKAVLLDDDNYKNLHREYLSLDIPMMDNYTELARQNPYINKLAPETQVYAPFTGDLGFDHIMDVLREDLTTGRIRPDQLSKVNMEQAVRRTSEYDQELAAKMNASRAAAREGLPTYREYPEGYKWIELNKPGAFAQESEAMGHSVRGYEPPKGHPDWTEASGDAGSSSYGHGGWEAIKSGKAKVYSLVDSKGAPHTTVEVRVNQTPSLSEMKPYMAAAEDEAKNLSNGYVQSDVLNIARRMATEGMPPRITQIKGKGNRAPNEEYLPYVQDFVKGGQWSDVGDIKHTGLSNVGGRYFTEPELVEAATKYGRMGVQDTPWEVARQRHIDAGVPEEQALENWVEGFREGRGRLDIPPEGMARGGLLHMADAGRVGRGLAQFGKRLLQDAPPPALKIKPPSDNVANVRQANFQYPKTIGNQTVAIEKLSGGVRMSDPKEVKRVKALADQMSGPEGYISRIVVDHNDNVIEGQHRLEALRQLGVKDVPVFKIEDLADTMPVSKMEQAMREVGGIHSDHVNQLMQHALDDISEGGIEGARGLDYGQFQKHYDAALDAVLGMRPVLPAAESDANLAKMLESSNVKERLYHGTGRDIQKFDKSKLRRTAFGEGFHLAESPNLANFYANQFDEGQNVMPVYAAIKNPYELKSMHDWYDIPGANDTEKTNLLKSQGYDGIKYPHGAGDDKTSPSPNVYVAFEPEQIKSATGNRGTYDTSNPDISKAEGGPAFKKLQFMDDGGIASPEENITSDQKPNRFSRVASEMYDEYKQSLANDYERLKASAIARAQLAKIAAAQFAGGLPDLASLATPLVNSDALLSAFPMARAAKIGLTGSPSTGRRTSVLSDEKTPYSLADYTNDINGNPKGGSEDIIKRAQKAGLMYGGTRMMYDAQEPDPSKEMLTMTPKEYEKWLNSEGRNRIDFGEQITTGRFSPVTEIGTAILGGNLGSKLARGAVNTGQKFKKGFDKGHARAMSRQAPPFLRELEYAPSKKRGGLTQLKAR